MYFLINGKIYTWFRNDLCVLQDGEWVKVREEEEV